MSLKRLISLTAVSLLGALALSGPAAADEGKTQQDDTWAKAACVLVPQGVAGLLGQQVESVFADEKQGGGWDAQQLMDTDAGTFKFAGQAICEGLDLASEGDKKGSPETVAPAVVQIDAKGIFDNLICGTGDAKGSAVVTSPTGVQTSYIDKATGQLVTETVDLEIHSQFAIQFVAGVGKLSVVVQQSSTDQEGRPQGGHSHVGENAIDQGQGQGVIQITPTVHQGTDAQPGCVGTPGDQQAGSVNEFGVEGAFETSLAGEGSQVTGQGTSASDA